MYTVPFLDLPPLRSAAGTVRLPGSKSISNRVLLLAGLSAGTTVVHDLLDSDDTQVMLEALRVLGCKLERDGEALHVTGLGGRLATKQAKLFLGNAGTAMRPLTAALALLAATQGGDFELSGVARMHERPIGDLVDALRQLGCAVDCLGTEGYPPLRLHASGQALQAAQPIRVRGDVSSQFLTALLLALPLVAHDGDIAVEVQGELISKPYVEITLNLLARFGIAVRREGWQRFTIPQGSAYRSPGRIHVEGDASSASYFIALGAIAADGEPVRIEGVGDRLHPGRHPLRRGGPGDGRAGRQRPGLDRGEAGPLAAAAITLDCNHIPDAAMTLAVMALYATGTTTPEQHRQLARQGNRPHRRHGRRAAQARRRRRRRATDFIEVTPLRRCGRRPSTPTTTTASRCASRWPPSRACRCASSTRSASARPSPTTSRRCSTW
jgi:3-phosphoshikimate 1-carboxyvinyltransferase